ncbi:hypothetical protein P9134_00390, partial [Bacillus cereus]|nr:hypothetical protein [Bacillus cereus]
ASASSPTATRIELTIPIFSSLVNCIYLTPSLSNATRLRLSFLNDKQDTTKITAAPTIITIGLIML